MEHRRPSEPTIDLPPGAAAPVRHGTGPQIESTRSPSYPASPMQYDTANRDNKQLYTVASPPTPQLPRYDGGDYKAAAGNFTEEPGSFYPGGGPPQSMTPGPQNFVGQQQGQQQQMPQAPYPVYHQNSQPQQPQQYQAPLPMTPPQMSQQHTQIYQQPSGPQNQMPSPPPMTPGGGGMTSSQPGPTVPMQFNSRNPNNLPTSVNGERDWSSSLCACSDVGVCCLAWWCPCVVYGQIQSRLSFLNRNNSPHPSGGDGCGSDCLVHGLLTGCCGIGWVLQIGQRTNVRNRYRIGGNGCEDCMCAWCCTPCSLTQEAYEIELEERALGHQATIPQMYVHDGKV